MIRHKELSPSPELLETYLRQWKGRDPESWWGLYARRFAEEMQVEGMLEALRVLYRKAREGKTVVLACFCKDQLHCHRRLVVDFLKGHNVNVHEYQPVPQAQAALAFGGAPMGEGDGSPSH